MTSSTSSWVERPFVSSFKKPVLVVEGARRDALWSWVLPDRIVGGRIRDRGAAESLAPEVAIAAKKLGFTIADTGAVIVGAGPGSFTGLRITISFAKGIACALNTPIVGVPSLQAMLVDAGLPDGIAMLEAYAKQVFAYATDVAPDVYLAPAITELRAGRRFVLDGAVPTYADLGNAIDLKADGNDALIGLATAGLVRLSAGEDDGWMHIVPNYGRPSSAELQLNLARK